MYSLLLVYKNLSPDRAITSHGGLGVTCSNAAAVLRTLPGVSKVECIGVYDGFELRDKVLPARVAPTHLVMSAPWVDTPFLQGLLRLYPHISFSVLYHSNVGFLQADRYAVKLLRQQLGLQLINHNFRVGVNSRRLQAAIAGALGRKSELLPNLYGVEQPLRQVPYHHGAALRVGIFGALRPQKNMLTAAWAALIMARALGVRLEMSLNSGRIEGGEGVLGAIRELTGGLHGVTLNEAGWMTWAEFRTFVATQNLLVSPSYTESFCNVVADGIAEGVPSAVSSALAWTPPHWQADADDAEAVAGVGLRLLRDPLAVQDGYQALKRHNAAGLAHWAGWLRESCYA